MAELDLTNIANTSIATPASGVTAVFVDTDKKLKIKNDGGTVQTLAHQSAQSIATAAGTTTLTNTSPIVTLFTGSTTQTVKLPDATTVQAGAEYQIRNSSTGLVTIQDGNAGALVVLSSGGSAYSVLVTAGTVAGVWDVDPVAFYADPTDTTKKIVQSSSGATTGTILTIAEAQSTSQTLNVPNIAGSSILITDTLAQTITGVKTMTNPTTAAGTNTVPSFTVTPGGTLMTSPTAGVQEADSAAFYNTLDTTNGRRYNDSWHLFRLTANGSAISTIADFFGTNDGIPTVLNGVYEIEWHCYFTVATGGTSTWTIVSTQTLTNMVADWLATPIAGFATQGASTSAGVKGITAASTALPVSGSLSAADHYHKIHAVVECATAGNIRLRQTMSAGTSTPLRDSFFRVRRLPAGNAGTFVA